MFLSLWMSAVAWRSPPPLLFGPVFLPYSFPSRSCLPCFLPFLAFFLWLFLCFLSFFLLPFHSFLLPSSLLGCHLRSLFFFFLLLYFFFILLHSSSSSSS